MKKTIALIAALVTFTSAVAQESADSTEYLRNELRQANEKLAKQDKELQEKNKEEKWNSIWSNNKYTILSYAPSAEVTADNAVDEKSKFTFAIAKGNTYFFHKKPIAGLVKIGLDVRWTDFQVTKYKDLEQTTSDNWTEGGSGDGLLSKLSDVGRWDMLLGVFGIGPTISVAPFSMFDNASKHLRLTVYGQYQPTVGLRLVSQDGETDTSFAYCNMFNVGGKIQYRRIALGVEKHWGSGKYSQIGNLFGSDSDEDSPKVKRKFSALRLYVAFSF